MSLAHLRIHKTRDDDNFVKYCVKSPDFSAEKTWETIGEVTIDKIQKKYEFHCLGAWASERVVPPHVYGLPDPDCEEKLADEFSGFGYGAWTAKIHRWIQRSIDTGQYPAEI